MNKDSESGSARVESKSAQEPASPVTRIKQYSVPNISHAMPNPLLSSDNDLRRTIDIQNAFLDECGPAAFALEKSGEIVYVTGPTHRFVSFPRGALTRNLFHLVPKSVCARLKSALSRISVETPKVTLKATLPKGDDERVQAMVGLSAVQGHDGLFLAVFRELTLKKESPALPNDDLSEEVFHQLEDELAVTRKELQRTIEQLKGANEELQSSNEELQATNEELETSREEMQSLNQELNFANTHLRLKIDELEAANNDLTNFLVSTNIPTLFLDSQLRIRRFTPTLSLFVNLLSSDTGRFVSDIAYENFGPDFLDQCQRVLSELTHSTCEVALANGWYLRTIQPYRTIDDRIDGVVITYADISDRKRAERSLRKAAEEFRIVADFTYDWEYWRSPDNQFLYITPSCERVTGYSRDEFIQDPSLYLRIVHPEDRATVENHLQHIASHYEMCDFDFRIIRRDGQVRWINHSCHAVFDVDGTPLGRRSTNRDITERVHSRSQLEEMATRNKVILSSMTDGLVIADASGTILEMNPAALALHQFESMDEIPSTLEEYSSLFELRDLFNHPVPLDHWPLSKAMKGERFSNFEVSVHRKVTGRTWYGSYGGTPVCDANGTVVMAIISIRDVTETIRARQQVASMAARYKGVFENVSDALIVIDGNGFIRELNPAAVNLYGLGPVNAKPRDVFALQSGFDFYHGITGAKLSAETCPFMRGMQGQTLEEVEIKAINRTTGTEWIGAYSVIPVFDGALDGLSYVVVSVKNITERKKLEDRLLNEKELLRTIIDSIPIMITIYDPATFAIQLNRAFEQISGWTNADARITNIMELAYPDADYRETVADFMRSLNPGFMDISMRCKDGTIKDTSWANVRLPDGRQVGIGLDITERRQFEEQLRRRADELTAANKELESFSYSVSHDLRNPLSAILNLSRLMEEEFGDQLGSDGALFVQQIIKSADKMNELINDLLSLARISRQEMSVQDVKLSELARTLIAEMPMPNSSLGIDIRIDESMQTRGDSRLISLALSNLLGNAVKYTSKVASPCVEFGSYLDRDCRVFYVRDNGAGFGMDQANRLFVPFQRLHAEREFPGTGVGLAIVERVIRRHGGRIWAQAEVGKGATFFFVFGEL